MAIPVRHLKRIDTVYCLLVAASSVLLVIGGLLRVYGFESALARLVAPTGALLTVALFPLGILIQVLTLRFYYPMSVSLCILLTGLFSLMAVLAICLS